MESLAYLHNCLKEEQQPEFIFVINWQKVPKIKNTYWLLFVLPFMSLSLTHNAWAVWLSKGNQTEQVKLIQQALKKAGYFNGPVTGYYGDMTEQAVKKFQTDKSITPTGIVGPTTMNVMQNLGYVKPTKVNNQNNQKSLPWSAVKSKKTEPEQVQERKPDNNISQTLELCNSNNNVFDLQNKLKRLGYYRGPVNGFFGRSTEVAVKKFQQAYNLQVDGIVGPQTMSALNKSLSAQKVIN